ncbi:efflux RND transporter periplasmic adaptor subunit [Bdellovibrio sp. BCCA]|uniref:efflux RND transporter periplasmic adaptor subunit n=1 Tax=Bdellovibrio sp. BCCA TaxID=3136281 RepID=UPI0030F24507
MKKFVYGALCILLLVSLWILFREQPVSVQTSLVKRGSFEEHLRVDGTIKSKTKMTVVAYATGDLERVDLQVGDNVEKGQRITTLFWDIRKDVVSPMTGVISKVYRESAGPILRGEPIVDVIDPDNLEIVAEVLTTDAVRIPEGAETKVTGIGNEEAVEAKVSRISRAGFMKLSALGIEEEKTEVYVQFINRPNARIGDNFHVELFITLYTSNNVLTVPLGALFKQENNWAVYVVKDKRARLKTLSIAKKNETDALVQSGLQEGEEVILFPGDQIHEGTKIRIQK